VADPVASAFVVLVVALAYIDKLAQPIGKHVEAHWPTAGSPNALTRRPDTLLLFADRSVVRMMEGMTRGAALHTGD
jgi:hypothetical protein